MNIPDSFLLDEVRCGFMIPAAVKQAWAAELEVLGEIDRVCKKHNIQYFADWGTLLGTVRHGGFIPWDDDLDIVMKREDYQKFLNVARYDMEDGFDVQTFHNHDDCWLFMGKVVGKNGFCFAKEHLRRFHNFPYIACVDIFVLDYVHKDPEKEEKRRRLCKYMLGVADSIAEGGLTAEEKERSLRTIEEMYGKRMNRIKDPVEMRRYLYGEVEKIFAEVPKQDADNLTQLFPWGLKGNQRQYAKECYAQSVELPFECTFMPVPMLYDKMLRKRYGEYYRLVKDAGAHNYPFFEGQKKNLQKVLDFAIPEFRFERTKLFRKKEEEDCKNLSYKGMAKECADELLRMKEQVAVIIGQMTQQPECLKQTVQHSASIEQAMDLLQLSQQLAIDLGNMLEQVLGEGSTIIGLLEQYCEVLYVIYKQLLADMGAYEAGKACNQLEDIHKVITDELEQNVFRRKTVLFLSVLAKDWDALHRLWQEADNDLLCDVYVVPLPYYYKDYDGSPRKVCYDVAEFPEEVHTLDYKLLTLEYLEMLHPEVIVIQNQYDSWNSAISIPEMFYSENIRKYTDELIYVPPLVLEEYSKCNEREYSNMKYYVTMPGVVYADCIMVQSENMRQLYIEKLSEFAGKETKDVWEKRVKVLTSPIMKQREEASAQSVVGQEKITFHKESNTKKNSKKKLFYGISLGAYIGDIETAQNKIKRNLRLFEGYKDQIDLTIQIFPDSADADEVRNYIIRLLESYPGKIVEKGVKCCIRDYDAYYGDVMPIVIKFRDAGKPVMIQKIELDNLSENVLRNCVNLVAEDCIQINNQLLFIARDINIIYSLDLDTGEVVLLESIPEEDIFATRLGAKIVYWKEEMIFVPMKADKIWIYKLKTKEWKGIKRRKIGDNKTISEMFQAVLYGDKLFMIGCNYPAIICLDLIKETVVYFEEPYRRLKNKREKLSDCYFRCDCVQKNNYIYLASCLENLVLEFDMNNGNFRWLEVGNCKNRYSGIAWDGHDFWLAPRYGTAIVKWNGKNETVNYELPSVIDSSKMSFLGVVCRGDEIIFPGMDMSHTVVISKQELDKMKVVEKQFYFYKKVNCEWIINQEVSGRLSVEKTDGMLRNYNCVIEKCRLDKYLKKYSTSVLEYLKRGKVRENRLFNLGVFCEVVKDV